MANYPRLPTFSLPRNVAELFDIMFRWSNELTRELDTRDTKEENRPSTNIYTVTTVTEIGRPGAGDVAYSTSSSIFRGYTTTAAGWVDFN